LAARAAELVTEIPSGDVYFKGLFAKVPSASVPGWLAKQRQAALSCLVYLHNKFAVRVVFQSLLDPDSGVETGTLGTALADMNIPDAPYSFKTRKDAATADGIAKWKQWLEANKAQYIEQPK
jgi:hypothetical protein